MNTYGDSYLIGVSGTPARFGQLRDVTFSDDLNDASDYIKREEDIDASVIDKLCGISLAHGPDFTATVSFQSPYQVQARRHKKRRINKKWAKRYGYITEFRTVTIENVQINRNE